jgi:hypothetical protein
MITGTFPASEKAKLIVIESTADGGLGKFYEMVQDSLAGKNEFETIFLSWTEAEEYQKEIPEHDFNWKKDYLELAKNLNLFFTNKDQNPLSYGLKQMAQQIAICL